jgi:hypothetical protein
MMHPNAKEDRAYYYRDWRMGLGEGLYATDVDQVEWTSGNGVLVPVAVIELTRYDNDSRSPNEGYRAAIRERMEERDGQGEMAIRVAEMLGNVPAYVVLFRRNLTEFWARRIFDPDPEAWCHMKKSTYVRWLKRLRRAHRG